MKTQYIIIETKDKKKIDLNIKCIEYSGILKVLLNIDDFDDINECNNLDNQDKPIEIPLPEIEYDILEKIKVYLNWKIDNINNNIEKNTGEQNLFFDNYLSTMDDDTLFKVILGANYMEITELLDICCKKVADYIKSCNTPREIRRRFNIKNDFTPEEENDIKKDHDISY